jgi:hypothetical protein
MRSGFRSLGWRRAVLMMCLLAFAGLIAVSIVNSRANHGKCARERIVACVGQAPAHAARSDEPSTGG